MSWFFPLCPPPPSTPYFFRQSPHHCSCPWVMHISSLASPFPILYFRSPWLYCNYLFVFNPLTSSPILPFPLPSGNFLVTNFFSLAFKSFSLSLTFDFLIIMCHGVGLFSSIITGLCASWTCMSTSFTKLGKFYFTVLSDRFPISCSFTSGTPIRQMLDLFKSQRLFIWSLFFGFFSSCSACLFFGAYVPNHWFDSQLHPLYCCFPINCPLFQLVYTLFPTGSFLCCWDPY